MLANTDPARSSRLAFPRGLGGVEVVVIIAVVGFLVMCVLIVLPRGRETSRMAGCQRNLMQVGVATQLYEQANRHYPSLPPFGNPAGGDSPVHAMLKALTIPDFLDLRDANKPPKPTEAPGLGARVPGLVCPSDPRSGSRINPAALSYRVNVGDGTDGTNGPFSPDRAVSSTTVEAADGASYTAGFAERLIGTGRDDEPRPMNYALVRGPVTQSSEPSSGADQRWRGDAGASWAEPGWRSAAYSHGPVPNAPTTCVAEDGRTATMTASSGHPGRINVWMLDGSLRGVTPSINPSVWRAMGSVGSAPPTAEPGR